MSAIEAAGRLDLAAAYRRLADAAVAAACTVADTSGMPADEDRVREVVAIALDDVDYRRRLVAAARRGRRRAQGHHEVA